MPSGWLAQHGYCFEVPAAADGSVRATPIPDMGRFSHEAVAVDPVTGDIYETEDNGGNSGFYRFIANTPGVLVNGGILQMLAVVGQPNYNTQINQTVGTPLTVNWVDIPNPNPAGTSSTAVFNQGRDRGGTPRTGGPVRRSVGRAVERGEPVRGLAGARGRGAHVDGVPALLARDAR